MNVKHVWSQRRQWNTLALAHNLCSSRNTVRFRDCTAVVLNPGWKVAKLDLWFISSVTHSSVLQLSRVMSSAGEGPEEGISNPKAYSRTVAEMSTSLHEPWTRFCRWRIDIKRSWSCFASFVSVGVAQMSLEVRCWGEAEEQREGE